MTPRLSLFLSLALACAQPAFAQCVDGRVRLGRQVAGAPARPLGWAFDPEARPYAVAFANGLRLSGDPASSVVTVTFPNGGVQRLEGVRSRFGLDNDTVAGERGSRAIYGAPREHVQIVELASPGGKRRIQYIYLEASCGLSVDDIRKLHAAERVAYEMQRSAIYHHHLEEELDRDVSYSSGRRPILIRPDGTTSVLIHGGKYYGTGEAEAVALPDGSFSIPKTKGPSELIPAMLVPAAWVFSPAPSPGQLTMPPPPPPPSRFDRLRKRLKDLAGDPPSFS